MSFEHLLAISTLAPITRYFRCGNYWNVDYARLGHKHRTKFRHLNWSHIICSSQSFAGTRTKPQTKMQQQITISTVFFVGASVSCHSWCSRPTSMWEYCGHRKFSNQYEWYSCVPSNTHHIWLNIYSMTFHFFLFSIFVCVCCGYGSVLFVWLCFFFHHFPTNPHEYYYFRFDRSAMYFSDILYVANCIYIYIWKW